MDSSFRNDCSKQLNLKTNNRNKPLTGIDLGLTAHHASLVRIDCASLSSANWRAENDKRLKRPVIDHLNEITKYCLKILCTFNLLLKEID